MNHQTWEILSVKLGNSSIKQGGECRFKHGEFEILTPNIGKIVKPESKMSRMEIYSKNHNILNTIYAIMCMGRAGTTDFFPAVMQNLAIRSNRNPLDRLANARRPCPHSPDGVSGQVHAGPEMPSSCHQCENLNSCEQSLQPVGWLVLIGFADTN